MEGSMLANQAGGAILGLALQPYNDRRQITQQGKLNAQQLWYNKQMTDYNNRATMDIWNKTNYPAQVQQMKKAGLNIGLMYKGAGEGGKTINTAGSVNAPNAPQGGGEIGMGMNMAVMAQQAAANIKLAEANAKLAETEARKKAGADTANVEADTQKKLSEVPNIQADTANKITDNARLAATTEKELEEAKRLRIENSINTEAYDSRVKQIQENAIAQGLENVLTKAKTNLTNEETNKVRVETRAIATEVAQRWTSLSLDQKRIELQKIGMRIAQAGMINQTELREFNTNWAAFAGQITGIFGNVLRGSVSASGSNVNVEK